MPISCEIQTRKQRWCDFLENRNCPRHLFMINCEQDQPTRPRLWPECAAEHIEWAWTRYGRGREQMAWLEDDALPYLDMLTGTEIFAEAFGCQVYRPMDNNPFALPLVHNAREAARIRPVDLMSSSLTRFFDMADRLRDRAGEDALFRLVDIQSPMDIVALIWDKNDLYIALLEEPDAVRELAAMVYRLLTDFLDTWFCRYGTDFIAHYPDYYLPRGVSVSEDEVGIISPAMFDQFFMPELAGLSERYGGIGIHCCADAVHQWDRFLAIPGLRLINLVQPRPVMIRSWSRFADATVQWPGWAGDGNPWEWPAQYPPGSRMILPVTASSREEAVDLCSRLQEACRRS
jgi:hypothetical protein